MHPEIHASKPGKCPKCGSQGKAKPTKKSHCAKQAQKQLLRKQEQLRQNVEVAKETENLHKIIILLR
jgi:hypothetical protein